MEVVCAEAGELVELKVGFDPGPAGFASQSGNLALALAIGALELGNFFHFLDIV